MVDLAKAKNLPLRIPDESLIWHASLKIFHPLSLIRLVRKLFGKFYCALARAAARKAQVRTNDHFFSIFGFWPAVKTLSPSLYIQLFKTLPAGTAELMVHPSFPHEGSDYTTSIQDISSQERQILQDGALKKSLKECSIQLVNWSVVSSQ